LDVIALVLKEKGAKRKTRRVSQGGEPRPAPETERDFTGRLNLSIKVCEKGRSLNITNGFQDKPPESRSSGLKTVFSRGVRGRSHGP